MGGVPGRAGVLGIDIGGTGIKAAPVDVTAGRLLADRARVLTPRPSTPEAVVQAAHDLAARFGAQPNGVGITFPGVVTDGWTRTAANVDHGWIDYDARGRFSQVLGTPTVVVNDADAAGIAEMRFGAGRGRAGTVLVLTLGTGIGSALFTDGVLVPNTELGHLELDGHDAEHRASAVLREEQGMSWGHWAHRLQKYLRHVEMLFSPSLIILGGGVSRKSAKFLPHIKGVRAELVPARLFNDAGIVGAALAAVEHSREHPGTGVAASTHH